MIWNFLPIFPKDKWISKVILFVFLYIGDYLHATGNRKNESKSKNVADIHFLKPQKEVFMIWNVLFTSPRDSSFLCGVQTVIYTQNCEKMAEKYELSQLKSCR